jgi:hypothetical protein
MAQEELAALVVEVMEEGLLLQQLPQVPEALTPEEVAVEGLHHKQHRLAALE